MAERDLELERMMKRELKARQEEREFDARWQGSVGIGMMAGTIVFVVLVARGGMNALSSAVWMVGVGLLVAVLLFILLSAFGARLTR